MANERAPGLGFRKGSADIALQNADKGSVSGQASENHMFNKHFNKELKLCEGKYTNAPESCFDFLTHLFKQTKSQWYYAS